MSWLAKVGDWIQLKPRYLFAIAAAAALLLFLPDRAAQALGVKGFREAYRGFIGAVFIVSGVLFLVHGALAVWEPVRKWIEHRQRIRRLRAQIPTLSPEECAVLCRYVDRNEKSQTFELGDGVIAGLAAQKIVYRASNASMYGTSFAYNIQPWAWEYLRAHPELLAAGRECEQRAPPPGRTRRDRRGR